MCYMCEKKQYCIHTSGLYTMPIYKQAPFSSFSNNLHNLSAVIVITFFRYHA